MTVSDWKQPRFHDKSVPSLPASDTQQSVSPTSSTTLGDHLRDYSPNFASPPQSDENCKVSIQASSNY
eukprot:351815-Amorphochlora_amoeboformis.AAC.1